MHTSKKANLKRTLFWVTPAVRKVAKEEQEGRRLQKEGGTVGGKKETGAEGRNSNGDRQV